MDRRTKIIATLGPATSDPQSLRAILEAGVDVVRLNYAHGDAPTHKRAAGMARQEAERCGKVVGVLADLPGPKMRTGPVRGDAVRLEPGSHFELTSRAVQGDAAVVSTSVTDLAALVDVGDEIFMADGEIVLEVVSSRSDGVATTVVRGGLLRSRKGMHVPAADRKVRAFTDEDRSALQHALDLRAEMVGLSFVRDAEDVKRARRALPSGGHRPRLVAKIETASALENLDGILREADAVMVARGDLGIQTPLDRMPLVQKEIIAASNRIGVPAITATEMLDSMTHAPLPTRAEITDIANAVLDGTDALMLSEETAVGDYPAAAVATMASTAGAAETAPTPGPDIDLKGTEDAVSWAVAHAAVQAAHDVGARAILCPTQTGATPRRVAAFRPGIPIVGLSETDDALGWLALVWGVVPLHARRLPDAHTVDDQMRTAVDAARAAGLLSPGDLVVLAAGTPGRRAGRTDYMRVARVQ